MDEWMAALGEAGITASQMIAENYGLARIPGTMSVLVNKDCVFLLNREFVNGNGIMLRLLNLFLPLLPVKYWA